ncbi:MAG: DUF4892 domain-containing protein [Aquamicrobium sp.]|uniref:OmpA family protein n=2 Tax=Aquamicrobium sp. TaxID=1872579 RepID=UPI00349ECE58|nr:DUF4892 domain-containing protein [Aquamicrobium sp.]
MLNLRTLLAGLVLAAGFSGPVVAQDVDGAADHPLIPRYEGSEIRGYAVSAFDEYELVAGATVRSATGSTAAVSENPIQIEGKVTHLFYRAPPDRSPLEVFRNYESVLAAAGFDVLFSCSRADCGYLFNNVMNPGARYNGLIYGDQQRYLAARLARPEGDVYVSLYVTSFEPQNRTFLKLDVVELRGMEKRMIVVEAGEMEQALARDGKIAIYGIFFDFDSATIQAESREQIDQLGQLLAGAGALQVLIVGHTDGQGAFDYNLTLSQRRAQAVVDALVRDYGIAASRLTPAGAGMVSPVASNRTEEGRAQNRRVEIVERYVAP